MPPQKQKERFNAKARQSVAGTSHKKRKFGRSRREHGEGQDGTEGESSSNALIIDPSEKRQREEADRERRKLLARSGQEGAETVPISSKKRKRLDAYIARQLKKEKRQQLIADLAESSAQVSDRSSLMRASTLGTGKTQSGQDRLEKSEARSGRKLNKRNARYGMMDIYGAQEDSDEDADLDRDSEEDVSLKNPIAVDGKPIEVEDDDDERQARIDRARALFSDKPFAAQTTADKSLATTSVSTVGSALALGPDGKPMMPVMKKRKAQKKKPRGSRTAWGRASKEAGSEGSEDSEFDSSASSEEEDDGMIEKKNNHSHLADAIMNGHEDFTDESVSSLSDDSSNSDDTDEEEQAFLEEVMRRRGMLGSPSRQAPADDDFQSSEHDSFSDESQGEVNEGEIPFTAFDNETGDSEENDTDLEEEAKDSDESSEDEEEDESDIGSEGEDSQSEREEGDDAVKSRRPGLAETARSQGFKQWANSALGLPDAKEERLDDDVYKGPEPVAGLTQKVGDLQDGTIRGPLGDNISLKSKLTPFAQHYYNEMKENRYLKHKGVERAEELQEARLRLPVLAEEDRIVRTIMENMVIILCGETGSGKTTQVPQFLFEAGFGSVGSANPGMIGVTQPRRVAALSMAARVGQELGLGPDRVSHQIRYDATVSPNTSIKFMTDGVLLRELAIDFMLHKYSVIIIDEAHERSVNTDVLIGVLSRVAVLRGKKWIAGEGRPLRIIIMSATLRVDDFAANKRLFAEEPPILKVEARQFPVVTHFNRRTNFDYVGEAYKKACKIHARLPQGGILIFLTGQAEIATVCQKLERRYGRRAIDERKRRQKGFQKFDRRANDDDDDEREEATKVVMSAKDGDVEVEEIDLSAIGKDDKEEKAALALDVDDDILTNEDLDALDSDDELQDEVEYDTDLPTELRDDSDTPMHILPLYSLLPSDRQMKVFVPPPDGSRLVVVATNVAETSLTIPGISYVVDCGRSKERKYDAANGIQSFEVDWISKASADQRAGRAGRTGPGHCYRLYSSNVYEEHFDQFAQPEIVRMPVDNLVLMMKSMNIDNVANFPFPTPPDHEALLRAEKLLVRLGALAASSSNAKSASQFKVTALGRSMSLFPLNTRLAKLLVQGHQHDCLPFVVALVAALSVGDPFLREESLHEDGIHEDRIEDLHDLPIEAQHINNADELERERKRAKRSAYFKALSRFAAMSGALSDPLRLLSVVGAYEHAGGSKEFCLSHFLVPKVMEEIHKLRGQLASLVQANAAATVDVSALRSPKLRPPTTKQLSILRQFLTSAFIDQIAIRADLSPEGAARVPMLQQEGEGGEQVASKQFYQQTKQGAKMQSTRNVAYLAAGIPGEACFIHKTSVVFHRQPPEWIIFSSVVRGRAKGDQLERQGRNWLKGVTVINAHWIYKLGPTLCTLSKPVEVDHRDTRAKLVQAAQQLSKMRKQEADRSKARNGDLSGGDVGKDVYLVPTYGTGTAFDAYERSSYAGWELPAVMAKQRLVNGKWITDI